MRTRILPCLCVLAVALSGCSREEVAAPDSLLASEEKLLERQVASLTEALADARKGELFPPQDIAIGLSENAVQSAVSQALPIERAITPEFRARIDRATVSFRAMQGTVTLEGRVWAASDPGTYADLILLGGLGDIDIDRGTGVLTGAVALDGWDVKRAAAVGAEADWIREVVRVLGADALDKLRGLVPDLRIPVGIEQEIDLPGVLGDPVTVPSGRVPLQARVSRVLPLSGKLWTMIRVETTGWEPRRAAERAK